VPAVASVISAERAADCDPRERGSFKTSAPASATCPATAATGHGAPSPALATGMGKGKTARLVGVGVSTVQRIAAGTEATSPSPS